MDQLTPIKISVYDGESTLVGTFYRAVQLTHQVRGARVPDLPPHTPRPSAGPRDPARKSGLVGPFELLSIREQAEGDGAAICGTRSPEAIQVVRAASSVYLSRSEDAATFCEQMLKLGWSIDPSLPNLRQDRKWQLDARV